MKYAQIVVGPAGSGKSTYCSAMVKHAEAIGRKISVVNMDPAAEYFDYNPIVDVRDLISVPDVMTDEDIALGPNGGLVFCLEYMVEHRDWIEENFCEFGDEYVLFDCPGQIELYTHMDVMNKLCRMLENYGFRCVSVFCLDSSFCGDRSKFFSGILVSLSTIINLEVPSVNILTKVDLLSPIEKRALENVLEPQFSMFEDDRKQDEAEVLRPRFASLSRNLAKLVDDYSLIKFFPFNIKDEECMSDTLLIIDNAFQYGEDEDVKCKDFEQDDDVDYNQLAEKYIH